jgi:hypothetical protein
MSSPNNKKTLGQISLGNIVNEIIQEKKSETEKVLNEMNKDACDGFTSTRIVKRKKGEDTTNFYKKDKS